jgi:hypothetical protein
VGTWSGRFGAAILLGVALTACQGSGSTKANSVGPKNDVLIVSFLDNCRDDSSARNGTVAVAARDFQPHTTVTLRWSVAKRDVQGSWKSVVTSSDGELNTDLDLPADVLKPGDLVEVWAQGSGKDGIMALRAKVPIGSC